MKEIKESELSCEQELFSISTVSNFAKAIVAE